MRTTNSGRRRKSVSKQRSSSSPLVRVCCRAFWFWKISNRFEGAGLGILRKVDFHTALIDEASQITEPCALIPLVKGVKRAVMVGDQYVYVFHKPFVAQPFLSVQLRPTVKGMAAALQHDVSLLERLYTGPDYPGMRKTMLEVGNHHRLAFSLLI
jgi:hypothetical protein